MAKLLFFVLSITLSQATYAAACSTNSDGEITQTSGICTATPDEYTIRIYETGVCTGIDPTSPTLPDFRNKCQRIFNAGSTPTSVIVQNNISSPLGGGTTTKPELGTYNYGYVIVEAVLNIKTQKTFTNPVTGLDNSVGQVCWTNGTAFGQTSCGDTVDQSTYAQNITEIDALEGNTFHNSYENDAEGLDDTYAYLVDSNDNLSTIHAFGSAPGQVKKLIGFARYNTPLVFDAYTSTFEAQFRVTEGLTIDFDNFGGTAMYSSKFKVITTAY